MTRTGKGGLTDEPFDAHDEATDRMDDGRSRNGSSYAHHLSSAIQLPDPHQDQRSLTSLSKSLSSSSSGPRSRSISLVHLRRSAPLSANGCSIPSVTLAPPVSDPVVARRSLRRLGAGPVLGLGARGEGKAGATRRSSMLLRRWGVCGVGEAWWCGARARWSSELVASRRSDETDE